MRSDRLRNPHSERGSVGNCELSGSLWRGFGDINGNGVKWNDAIHLRLEYWSDDTVDHSIDCRKLQCDCDRLERLHGHGLRDSYDKHAPRSYRQFNYNLWWFFRDVNGNSIEWHSTIHVRLEYRSNNGIHHGVVSG